MARDNKINMPQSGGGLTRYFDGHSSNIMITPHAAVITIVALTVLLLIIKFYLG
ncbi:MAG: hypothetical protein ACMXX9_01795 [Candidatus Woesearchaeota archaeon]